MGTPAETEPFSLVANKFNLRINNTNWHARVFCTVEYHDSSIRTHGRDDIRILRLVSSLVDFSLVVNLLYNGEFHFHRCRFLSRASSIASNLLTFLVVIFGIWSSKVRKLDMRNLKEVLCFARGMGSDEQSMGRVILVRRPMSFSLRDMTSKRAFVPLNIREPLGCKSRPFQRIAKYRVVQERSIFFPCLVLLINKLLLRHPFIPIKVFISWNAKCQSAIDCLASALLPLPFRSSSSISPPVI